MAIKKSDGTVYKLSSPNPLTKSQDHFDLKKLIFHNFSWETIVVNSKDSLLDQSIEIKQDVDEHVAEEESVEQIEEFLNDVPKLNISPPPIAQQSEVKNKLNLNKKNIVIIHCQPATTKKVVDELYGDSYTKISYGEKFTFEGIVLSRGDLEFSFWTNIELLEHSIVYPKRYTDGSPFEEFRWWKISSLQPKSGGYLIHCTISNYQPDFSD